MHVPAISSATALSSCLGAPGPQLTLCTRHVFRVIGRLGPPDHVLYILNLVCMM